MLNRNRGLVRNKSIDTKQIGRELGVRYVIEGSVRRLGDQTRINAQLIDAESDTHLWAERFSGDTSDLCGLQDEITRRIAVELNLELVKVEAARPTDNRNALEYILRGRGAHARPPSRDRYTEAIRLFEGALALDPMSVEPQSRLAISLASRVLANTTDTAIADTARAEVLAEQALDALPTSPLAHFARGQVLRVRRRFEEAIPEYETVLAFNRNWVHAFHALADCKLLDGIDRRDHPACRASHPAQPS